MSNTYSPFAEPQTELELHRAALISAYTKKTIRAINSQEAIAQTQVQKRVLKSLGPIRDLTTVGKVVPKITDHWWKKKATIAGERCTSRQLRISSGMTEGLRRSTVVQQNNDMGDFCDDPRKARKLLLNRSYAELQSTSTGDFKSEVTWRLGLRDN